jgi:hypothetical protein
MKDDGERMPRDAARCHGAVLPLGGIDSNYLSSVKIGWGRRDWQPQSYVNASLAEGGGGADALARPLAYFIFAFNMFIASHKIITWGHNSGAFKF